MQLLLSDGGGVEGLQDGQGPECLPCCLQLISSKVPKAEYIPTIIRRDDPAIIPILYVSAPSPISGSVGVLFHPLCECSQPHLGVRWGCYPILCVSAPISLLRSGGGAIPSSV